MTTILPYASVPKARLSRLAIMALVLSIIAALVFFTVIPCVIALIFAVIAEKEIDAHPLERRGRSLATAAKTLSVCTLCLGAAALVLLPGLGRTHCYAGRSSCAANLRGILNSMAIYAAANSDQFPIVTYAAYSPALASPTATATRATADTTISTYYEPTNAQAGSVTASLWVLVLQGMSPKLFICKFDPLYASSLSVAETTDSAGNFFNNFQSDSQLSYSFAYPWNADGKPAKWWTNTTDASLPLAADMTPQQGTCTPKRNLTPAAAPRNARSWNSGNHGGDGQNVGFADVHVDYVKGPNVGHGSDNIYSTSGNPSKGPADFGGLPPGKSPPNLSDVSAPFDIILMPARDLDTGRL